MTSLQTWITAALVVACSSYVLWSLMPATLRRRVAAWSGRPQAAVGGCGGCDGCGSTPRKAAGAASAAGEGAGGSAGTAVIRIVRKPIS